MMGISKGKAISYLGVLGIAALSPELLFLNVLQLEVYVLGTDYSRAVAYFFGAVIGAVGTFLIRKLSGSGAGVGFISSILKGGNVL